MAPDDHANTTPRPSGVDASLKRNGGLTYLELPATDIHQSSHFYRSVLHWQIRDDAPEKFSDPAGNLIGRFITSRSSPAKPGMIPYFYVNDIRAAVDAATAAAGQISKPLYPDHDLLIAILHDPAGNLIGLWQEA